MFARNAWSLVTMWARAALVLPRLLDALRSIAQDDTADGLSRQVAAEALALVDQHGSGHRLT